jgi:hypothetical protein
MGETCGTYGELRGSVSVPERKKLLSSPRCRWEDIFNIEHSCNKFGVWTDLAESSIEWRNFLDELSFYYLLNELLHTLYL